MEGKRSFIPIPMWVELERNKDTESLQVSEQTVNETVPKGSTRDFGG